MHHVKLQSDHLFSLASNFWPGHQMVMLKTKLALGTDVIIIILSTFLAVQHFQHFFKLQL